MNWYASRPCPLDSPSQEYSLLQAHLSPLLFLFARSAPIYYDDYDVACIAWPLPDL